MPEALIEIISSGGIAVLRTDTLYGIVGRADSEAVVARIYDIKQRSPDKPLIVLVAKPTDAYDGAVAIAEYSDGVTPTSVVVDSPSAPVWLRHEDGSVAYRVPVDADLCQLLEQTGPLVAPSANPEGLAPAKSIAEAKAYFGDKIDVYLDGDEVPINTPASRLFRIDNNQTERLR